MCALALHRPRTVVGGGDAGARLAEVCAYDPGVDVLLRAENLTKQYGSVTALDHVTFEIGATVTGLLGANGAGKSTAIKLFLGLTGPTSGRAEVLGREAGRDEQVPGSAGIHARARLPALGGERRRVPHAHGRDERLAAAPCARPCSGHAAPRRAVRGALPGNRRLLDRHEAAGQARPDAGARPRSRAARRAHRRARSAGARGDARADSQDAPGVRDQRGHVVPPHGGRRAHVRAHPRARERPRGRGGRNVDVHRSVRDALHRGHGTPTRADRRARASAA